MGVNQAYSRLSTTHGHITDCKLDSVVYVGVYACEIMWTCLVRAERSTPDIFACQATDSIPPQVSRKESLRPFTRFILTSSWPVGGLTH